MSAATVPLAAWLDARRAEVEAGFARFLPGPPHWPAVLHEAMQYSLLAGGKRLRPVLTLAAAEAVAAADAGAAPGSSTAGASIATRLPASAGGSVAAGSRATADTDAEAHARRLALPAACAIEMIHTYSLIHDDLPAMDDDSLRRGRPTAHVQFGEGMAILAGDGLLTEAFALLAREPDDAATDASMRVRKLRTLALIADAAGAAGMVGGQAIDLHAARPHVSRQGVPQGVSHQGVTQHGVSHQGAQTGAAHGARAPMNVAVHDGAAPARPPRDRENADAIAGASVVRVAGFDADMLRDMHARKTGALIRAAAVAGAVMAGATPEAEAAVSSFATDLGLAFQIVDDVLDVEGTAADLGKTAGKDAASGKPTYPALFGLAKSKQLAQEAIDRARAALERARISGRLPEIAAWVVERSH